MALSATSNTLYLCLFRLITHLLANAGLVVHEAAVECLRVVNNHLFLFVFAQFGNDIEVLSVQLLCRGR